MYSRIKYGTPLILRNAPDGGAGDGGAGGGDGTGKVENKAPESVLFPNDKPADTGAGDGKPADAGQRDDNTGDDDKSKTGDDKTGGDQSGKTGKDGDGKGGKAGDAEWKEYVPDPNKSEAENAALKAEHDKTKPAEDKRTDDEKALDTVPPAEGGKYDKLVMPEGVTLDQPLLDRLTPKFIAKGMTHKDVQEFANELIAERRTAHEDAVKDWNKTVLGWVDTAKNDPEIGGDKWGATKTAAQRFADTYGTPALKEYLNASGAGNHPELIRIFAKAGAGLKEDEPPPSNQGGKGQRVDAAHVLFPNDKPKGD